MALASLVLEMKANIANWTSGIAKANQSLGSMEKKVSSLNTAIGGISKTIVGVTGFLGIARVLKSFVDEAGEAEKIAHQLAFTMETLGYNWKNAERAVTDFALSIQKTTRFSDEEARQALNDMFLYTNKFSQAQLGAKLAMDMTVRTGQDLNATTRLIGMAMSGNVERLGRYIPGLKNLDDILGKNATATEKWEYALNLLTKYFSGTAVNDVESYTGKLKQFSNAWSEAKEAMGNILIGPATGILTFLKVGAQGMQGFAEAIKRSADELRGLASIDLEKDIRDLQTKRLGMIRGKGGILGSIFGYDREAEINKITIEIERKKKELEGLKQSTESRIKAEENKMPVMNFGDEEKRIKELLDANKDLRESLSKQALVDERMAWAELGNEMAGTGETFDQMFARQKALKEVLESSVPIYETVKEDWGAIGNELVATAEAYGITVDELLRIRDVLDSGIKDNERFVESLREFTVIEGLLSGINRYQSTLGTSFIQMEEFAITSFQNIESALSESLSTMFDGTKSFAENMKSIWSNLAKSIIKNINDIVARQVVSSGTNWLGLIGKAAVGAIGGGVGGGLGGYSGYSPGWENFQHGGIVNRPTMSMIGEAGPEAVIPLKGGKVPIEGGGGNTTVIMYIEATDVDSFERKYGGSVTKIIHRNKKSAMARI